MPRPTKRADAISIPLEIATGKLSSLERFSHRLIRLRITQALDRHPDLTELLKPILNELEEHSHSVVVAKTAISTLKSLLKNE